MNALRTAIYSKSQEVSSFNTAIGGRFYFDKAPQEPTYPMVVAHEIVSNYDFTFQEDFENVTVQFNIYSRSSSAAEAGAIYDHLKSLFDWTIFSVTGYTIKKVERNFSRQFWDETKMEYVYATEYLFMIQKN